MPERLTIEIGLPVHKAIEAQRRSFEETHDDILMRLLDIGANDGLGVEGPAVDAAAGRPWVWKGVRLPHGTQLRMSYNGAEHHAEIRDGVWVLEEGVARSPSGAASLIARTRRGRKTHLDGWRYWQARLPGEALWTPIAALQARRGE